MWIEELYLNYYLLWSQSVSDRILVEALRKCSNLFAFYGENGKLPAEHSECSQCLFAQKAQFAGLKFQEYETSLFRWPTAHTICYLCLLFAAANVQIYSSSFRILNRLSLQYIKKIKINPVLLLNHFLLLLSVNFILLLCFIFLKHQYRKIRLWFSVISFSKIIFGFFERIFRGLLLL